MPKQIMVKMTRKGQITLPKPFRDALGVKEDDYLWVDLQGDKVVLNKPGLPEAGEAVGGRAHRQLMKDLEAEREKWR